VARARASIKRVDPRQHFRVCSHLGQLRQEGRDGLASARLLRQRDAVLHVRHQHVYRTSGVRRSFSSMHRVPSGHGRRVPGRAMSPFFWSTFTSMSCRPGTNSQLRSAGGGG